MKQKGFTLVEILVVLAVGGLIIPVALALIHQVVWGTARTNSQITSLVDVNQAALMLKKDLLMSQTTNLDIPLVLTPETPELAVNLGWIDHTTFVTPQPPHSSSFVLSGTNLRRTYDGNVRIVGRYITSLSLTQNERVIDVIITSTSPQVPQRIETLNFSVYQRQDPIE